MFPCVFFSFTRKMPAQPAPPPPVSQLSYLFNNQSIHQGEAQKSKDQNEKKTACVEHKKNPVCKTYQGDFYCLKMTGSSGICVNSIY